MVSCDSFCFLGRHWVFESQFAMAYDILGETRCICHVGQTQALGENGNVTNVKLLRAGSTVDGFVFLPPTRYMFTVVFLKIFDNATTFCSLRYILHAYACNVPNFILLLSGKVRTSKTKRGKVTIFAKPRCSRGRCKYSDPANSLNIPVCQFYQAVFSREPRLGAN